MTKIKFLILAFLALCFLEQTIAQQTQKVYMPFFEVLNLKKEFQYSTTKLLKTYIESGGRYEVIMQAQADSVVIGDNADAVQRIAKERNVNYFITGSLNRLGETVVVSINLHETETGNRIWFDQLKARTPDDFDPIFQRIGKSIGTNNKATGADDIYSVTQYDSKELATKESTSRFGISIGGMYPLGQQSSAGVLSGFSIVWDYDNRNMIFGVRPAIYFSDMMVVYNIGIEVMKPFTSNANGWFAGGGMAIGGTAFYRMENETYMIGSWSGSTYVNTPAQRRVEASHKNGGLLISAGGGYMFNRTSRVNLRASANYVQGLYKVGSAGYTGGLQLKLELLW